MFKRSAIKHHLAAGWLCVVACLLPTAVQAQAQDDSDAALHTLALSWIDQNLDTGASADSPLRAEIEVGSLSSRLRLAPCNHVEPYLPRGAKLWGRTRIGLRCVDGPTRWNVFLPITVKVWGPAWVIRQPVAPGAALSAEDAEPTEVDWAEHPAPVLARQADWEGMEAARGLMPGTVLRQSMVKPAQIFAAGTQVKVVVSQAGFALSATGMALSHGYLGQNARIRMPNGRVLTGKVQENSTVQLPI